MQNVSIEGLDHRFPARGSIIEMKAVTNCNQFGRLAYPRIEICDVPLLSYSEAMEKLKLFREKVQGKQQFLAMYSSIFGGITTDPTAMDIPMEAEEVGVFAGIWLDSDGLVAEGPSMNMAFVSKERELVMPQCDKVLSGCTVKRVLTLAECLVREGMLKGIRMNNVTVEEGKNSDGMMLLGSGILVLPVVQWDEQIIGRGKEGSVTQTLLNLIVAYMKSTLPVVGTRVPY